MIDAKLRDAALAKVTTFAEHQRLALRTAGAHPESPRQLPCWGLGLAGEAAETSEKIIASLEDSNGFLGHTPTIEDELGDTLWYAAVGSHAIGLTFQELLDLGWDDLNAFQAEAYALEGIDGLPRRLALPHVALQMMIRAGTFADQVKKVAFHRHPFEDHQRGLETHLAMVVHYIAVIGHIEQRTLSEIATRNIEKLQARYPRGFSTAASRRRVT